MFLKIFLSFWITIGIFAAAQEAASYFASNEERFVLSQARETLDAARPIPAAFEAGGAASARRAIDAYRTQRGLFADLLLSDRTSVTDQPARPAEIQMARLADRVVTAGYSQAAVNAAEGLAGQTLTAGGERVTLVVGLPRRTSTVVSRALLLSSPVRLVFILLIGGCVCFVAARHLSRPVVMLSAAAAALADGRLQTRVGPRAARRRDELGTLARNFDAMAERIEALVAGQRRLLGDVSHELRSPLTRLRVGLSLARQRCGPDSEEYFNRIEHETARLDRLIEQLLTLARIESGGVAEVRAPLDLATIVEEVVADGDFEARAAGKRVVLTSFEPIRVNGMPELVRSAVENVVRNAIRHTAPGTSVSVSLRTAAAATIVVCDHGPGVDPASLSELFKPFWRGQSDDHGAGLGLALAERIAQMHGGRITAENAEGGGLIVTIALPL
jgi:signal transduction histidine kinase